MKNFINFFIVISFTTLTTYSPAQNYFKIQGYVTNESKEPLIGVYVRAVDLGIGTITNENGQYEITLIEGLHRLSFTHIGYEPKRIDIPAQKNEVLNIILKPIDNEIGVIEISNKKKDLSYEIIRKVIENKETYANQFITQKRNVYVKSVEKTISKSLKKQDNQQNVKKLDESPNESKNDSTPKLNLFEGDFVQHIKLPNGFKEEKNAAKKLGYQQSLFYVSTTDANFDFNQNLIKVKKLGDNAYISPISNTAFVSYRFRLLGSRFDGERKVYTIQVIPRKLGNALFKGQLEIWDSLFTIKNVDLTLPKRSLIEYDQFSLKQHYSFQDSIKILTSETFNWKIKNGSRIIDGECVAKYSKYKFDSIYPKRFFNSELARTADDAYEKDTSFWVKIRPVPLTYDENKFIRMQDSIKRIRTSKAYLDSIDSAYNKITLLKAVWSGMGHINRDKKTEWSFASMAEMIDPVAIGGFRLKYNLSYYKRFENRKSIFISPTLNYGFRNNDIKGNLSIETLYNPKKLSRASIYYGKYFGFVNQFATFNDLFNRQNFFEQDYTYLTHSTELLNGFYLFNSISHTLRKPLNNFKFNPDFDSTFVNNVPQNFEINSDVRIAIGISYTPKQLYISEPNQKIVLGSKYPTFSLTYKQAVPNIGGSITDFKEIELGITQKFMVGIFGTSQYSARFGTFLDTSYLQIMDYKYQRGGDPYFFMPPMFAYQLIDSTFPTFRGFLETHYTHQFNGFLTSKVPLINKTGIRTMAGAGLLIVPERNYQYSELFGGINRIFRIGRERFRLGLYYVVAQSNTQGFSSGFKFSIVPYNTASNSWSF
jgi:hypothetical protein